MTAMQSPPVRNPELLNEPATDDHDSFCHSLDAQGRAFCFADLSRRTPHQRMAVVDAIRGGVRHLARCPACGRLTCPRCNEIEAALGRRA